MLHAKYTKPPQCDSCPLRDTGIGFVPDKEPVNDCQLIVVGEAPGKNEVIQGEPFVGKAGFVLKEWGLRAVPSLQLAAEQGRIYLGNTLRCLPPNENGRAYPVGTCRTTAEIHCRTFDKWVSRRNAVCLLLGEAAQRYWFRDELAAEDAEDRRAGRKSKGILGRIGRVYERDGRTWVFGPHPAWVLRQPELVEHLQRSLVVAGDCHSGSLVRSNMVHILRDASVLGSLACSGREDIGLDLEWGNDGQISVFGFSWDGGKQACAFSRTPVAEDTVRQFLARIGNGAGGSLVGHNILAADLPQLRNAGLTVGGTLRDSRTRREGIYTAFDTMLALHTTHAHLAGLGSYDLRSLVLLYGKGNRAGGMHLDWKEYATDIWRTCALDASAALRCSIPIRSEIRRANLEATCEISHEVAPIFQQMYEKGVKLDVKVLEEIHKEREASRTELEATLPTVRRRKEFKRKEAVEWDEPINPRSSAIINYFKQNFDVRLNGRSREDFEHLISDRSVPVGARELAQTIVSLSRLGSDSFWVGKVTTDDEGEITFGKVDEQGFCHPEYNVVGTPDRPSCTGTNIQNFPRTSEDSRRVPLRAAVVAPTVGMVLVAADFAHVESYTNAIEAGDWERVKALQEGRLSHENTAKLINDRFGLSLTRQQGKTCNHAFDKGESGYNLARRLFGDSSRVHVARAESIIQLMLSAFPRTQGFRKDLWERCRSNPYVARNVFGRRLLCFGHSRYGEDSDSTKTGEAVIRDRWKKALAFLGRSSAVDVLLRVMAKVYYEARLDEWSLPYIEIHDELVYAVPEDRAERYAGIVKEAFEEPVPELGNVSLPCSVQIGKNWAQCK